MTITCLRRGAQQTMRSGPSAIALMAAWLLVSFSGTACGTPLPDGISGAVWTSTPTAVDRKTQSYERLPTVVDPYGLKFRTGPRLIVFDSASFALNGRIHLLDGVRGLPPKKICQDEQGRRLACGANAAARLRALLRGKLIECRRKAILPIADILDCRIAGQSLSKSLIETGAASAADDRIWPTTPIVSAR